MNKIISRFLRDLAEIVDRINVDGRPRKAVVPMFTVSVILTFLVSIMDDPRIWLVASAYVIILIIASRHMLRFISKAILYLVFLSVIIGLPILVTGNTSINSIHDIVTVRYQLSTGLPEFVKFVVRVTLAPLPLIATLYFIGWPNLARQLYSVPLLRKITALTTIFILHLPRLLRHTLSLLLAREARHFDNSLKRQWKSLSTVVGDLIITSASYSRKMQQAIEARTFNEYPFEVRR